MDGEMNKIKKFISILICLSYTAFIFTGCAKDKGETSKYKELLYGGNDTVTGGQPPPVTQTGIVYNAQAIYDGYGGYGTGNGDRIVNKGETIYIKVQLKNTGSSDANGVTATLSTTDSYVTINQSYKTDSYGTITGSNGTDWNDYTNGFQFTVSATTPIPRTVTFSLAITDTYGNTWSSNFNISVQ